MNRFGDPDRVVIGNIGAPGRINYTIVGDGVNTGQRLEGLGKELDDGGDVIVLVSACVAETADQQQIELRQMGLFQLKGNDARWRFYDSSPSDRIWRSG